ncbi:MAG TPA: GTP cyclohydrolase [Saprospirales bacterium]|nr:GTP cyclohydrolase [Saprospirales bacterium]
MIHRLAEGALKTRFGEYREILYYDGQKETIVMVMGSPEGQKEVLCRIHSSCIYGHVFNSVECDCRQQMEAAQQLIQEAGCGIIILMDQEGKGNGHLALMKSQGFKKAGMRQAEAYMAAGYADDARDFRAAAKILKDLEVKSVSLITDNPLKAKTLEDLGIPLAPYPASNTSAS